MFSSLTKPDYPKAAIGLEKENITVLALQREGGFFGIKQAATVELPTNLLNPSFTERNISNAQELVVLIQDAVTSAGLLNQKNWSVSLPSASARSAILTLDSGSDKGETEEVLDWKAEQTFGSPAAELRITRQKIANDRDGKVRYFATAVKLSVIDEFEVIFENFGWKAGLILPRAVCETAWLINSRESGDSLLISSQDDGFTALLLHDGEPRVVRSVTCTPNETDDEIYRLLMFYNDRFAGQNDGHTLNRLLAVGKGLVPSKIREISQEALGKAPVILRPEDIRLNIPASNLNFDDIAAPAGLAALGWK